MKNSLRNRPTGRSAAKKKRERDEKRKWANRVGTERKDRGCASKSGRRTRGLEIQDRKGKGVVIQIKKDEFWKIAVKEATEQEQNEWPENEG